MTNYFALLKGALVVMVSALLIDISLYYVLDRHTTDIVMEALVSLSDCPTVENLSATVHSNGSILIEWSHPSEGEPDINYDFTYRKVLPNGSLDTQNHGGESVATSLESFTDQVPGLSPGNYRVVMYYRDSGCNLGSTFATSNTISIPSISICDEVKSASFSDIGESSFKITWQHPDDRTEIDKYVVKYGTGSVEPGNNSTNIIISDLTPSTTYNVEVCSRCSDDTEVCYDAGSVTTTPPNPCEGFSAIINIFNNDSQYVCEGSSRTLQAEAYNGSNNYTYQWAGPNISGQGNSKVIVTPSNMATANYSLTITDATNNCTAIASKVLFVDDAPNVSASADKSEVCPGSPVNLTASANGGDGGYSFSWNDENNSVGSSIQVYPTENTIYTVTVTDNSGCTDSDFITVLVNSNTNVTIQDAPNEVCYGSNVTISAALTGGYGTIGYQWEKADVGQENWQTIGGNTAVLDLINLTNTFRYRVTANWDGGSCSEISSPVTINVLTQPQISAITGPGFVCEQENVTLNVSASGGPSCSSIRWEIEQGSDNWVLIGSGGQLLTPGTLDPGIHQFRAVYGCTDETCPLVYSTEFSLQVNALPSTATVGYSSTFCENDAYFTVVNPQNEVTYSWDFGPFATTETRLATGSVPTKPEYVLQDNHINTTATLTYWLNEECPRTFEMALTIYRDPADFILNVTSSQPTSCDSNDGTITVTDIDPPGSCITVSLDQQNWQTERTFTNLAPGTYTVYVRKTCGPASPECMAEVASSIELTAPPNNASATIFADQTVLCAQETTTISVSELLNSPGNYTLQLEKDEGSGWIAVSGASSSDPNQDFQVGPLTQATQFRLKIIDNSGSCADVYSNTLEITADLVDTDNDGVSDRCDQCPGEDDQIDNNNNGIPDGCESDPCNLSVTINDPGILCVGQEVILNLSISGGQEPFSTTWSTGETTENIPVSPGSTTNYSVTVTDANGCEVTEEVTVQVQALPSATVTIEDPSCGNANGSITLSFSDDPNQIDIEFSTDGGGSYPYSSPDIDGSFTISGLAEETYDLWVRWGDASCPVNLGNDITLTDQSGPELSLPADQSICAGESLLITAGVDGGQGNITYLWNTGETTESINVSPGSVTAYSLTVTDENGCSDNQQITITSLGVPSISLNYDQITVCTDETLTVTATISGGSSQFTQQWEVQGEGGSWAEVNGANGANYTTPALNTTKVYRIKVSDQTTGCVVISNTVDITINPDPNCGPCTPGAACDDGDDCTINDVYDEQCNCAGVDADDSDNDGIPDTCDDEVACVYTDLSSLDWEPSSYSTYGSIKKDQSFDGNGIAIDNISFQSGIGVHAHSEVIYHLGGQYSGFTSVIGIDSECDDDGSVIFQVYTDGNLAYESPTLTGYDDTTSVFLSFTTPVHELRLVVTDAGNGNGCDHADWANAKLLRCSGFCEEGTPCDDGDPCTINDQYDGNCNCAGVSIDDDNDGVPNGCDECPGHPDDVDLNNNGIPDGCDTDPCNYLNVSSFDWEAESTSMFDWIQKDLSIDGNTMTIGGATYAHGIGVHAPSDIIYNLGGQYSTFQAIIGVDDEVEFCGSVVFQLIDENDNILYDSGVRTSYEAGLPISVDIDGVNTLRLVVTDGGDDIGCDHANWAMATFGQCPDCSDPPVASFTKQDPSCSVANGSIDLSINGGLAPFTFAWSNGQATEDLSGLAPGTYDCLITDANGCKTTTSVTLIDLAAISLSFNDPAISCAGEAVALSVSASGGLAPYGYSWSTGEQGDNISVSPVASTSYTVTITDANGCTITDDVTVQVQALPSATITTENPSCGNNNGTITFQFTDDPNQETIQFSLDGGLDFDTYSTSDANGSLTITGLAADTYDLWARWGDASCPVDLGEDIILSDQAGLSLDLGSDQTLCYGASHTITANASGGVEPYTHFWSTGESGSSISVSPETTTNYTVTVTDVNGCTITDDVTVLVQELPSVTITIEDPTCGNANGAITLSFSDAPNQSDLEFSTDGGISYPYSSPDTDGSFTISGLIAETYDLWGRWGDASCPVDLGNDITLTNQEGPSLSLPADQNICAGESLLITAIVSEGQGNITYNWSTGETTASITVSPGTETTYSLTVTDENGCTDNQQITISPIGSPTLTLNYDPITLCANEVLNLQATLSGGSGSFDMQWEVQEEGSTWTNATGAGASGSDVLDFTTPELAASKAYRLQVTDLVSGCVVTSSPAAITIDTDPNCGICTPGAPCDDGDDCTVNDVYDENCGCAGVESHDTDLDGIPDTCDDEVACISTELSSLDWDPLSTNNYGSIKKDLSFDGNDMAIDGVPYQTGLGVHALSEVIYQLGGQYSSFEADLGIDSECDGDGSVIFEVYTDGDLVYTSPVLTGYDAPLSIVVPLIGKNELRLVVTDAGDGDGCDHANWADAQLIRCPGFCEAGTPCDDGDPCTINDQYDGNCDCVGESVDDDNDGVLNGCDICPGHPDDVDLNNNGIPDGCDTDPCDYLNLSSLDWEAGSTSMFDDIRKDLSFDGNTMTMGGVTYAHGIGVHAPSNLIYNLGGQYSTFQAIIGVDDEVEFCGSVVFQLIDENDNVLYDSGLRTSYEGGLPITVDVSGVNTLRLVVTDGGDDIGCDHANWAMVKLSQCSTCVDPPVFSFTKTNASCSLANGSIDLSITGGTPPYTYTWNTGASSASLDQLVAGTYEVLVEDANGCYATGTTIIDNVAALNLAIEPIPSICASESASINVEVSGGTPPFAYEWSNGVQAKSMIVRPEETTTYTVTVTDDNGCSAVGSTEVTVNLSPIADAGPDQSICQGASVTLGGNPAGPDGATYSWSTGASGTIDAQTDGKITVSPAVTTTYTLTITDGNGCTSQDEVTITVSSLLDAVLVATDGDCQDLLGSAEVRITGGAPPYYLNWSNGADTEIITGLEAGNYEVTITDAGGCSIVRNTAVAVGSPININFNISEESFTGEEDGSITANTSGGVPPYTYRWSNGVLTAENEGLPAGTYTVTVYDAEACRQVGAATVNTTNPEEELIFERGTINGVGSQGTTVNLENTYSDMVVIATIVNTENKAPAVSKVTNAQGSSFDLNLIQAVASGNETSDTYTIHYFVIEAGIYQSAIHGIDLEAGHYSSSNSSYTGNWQTESFTPQQNYAQPIVLGQVISTDSDPSVFWSSANSSRTAPPTSGDISMSVHTGALVASGGETIDYVILNAGVHALNDIGIEAGTSSATISGIDSGSSLQGLSNTLGGADVAILSAAGMINDDGGWPVLYGNDAVNANRLLLAIDEDQSADAERSHSGEAVTYLVFQGGDNVPVSSCELSLAIALEQPSCDNGGLGLAEAVIEGGVSPYSYEWSNGETNSSVSDLVPGAYTLNVIDANGCAATEVFTIEDNGIVFSALDNQICDLANYVEAIPMDNNEVLFILEGLSQTDFDALVQNTGVTEINLQVDYQNAVGFTSETLNIYKAGVATDVTTWGMVIYEALYDTDMQVSIQQSAVEGQCLSVCTTYKTLSVAAFVDEAKAEIKENPEIELTEYECGDPYTPTTVATDTYFVYDPSNPPSVFTVRDFPVLITGNLQVHGNGEYSGEGIIPLPFNKQTVKVEFYNVLVNAEGQIFDGVVSAVSDDLTAYDFSMDQPLLLDPEIDICQPPPPPPGYNSDGIDPVTGLDPWGFDENGLHENGTAYDDNGFDVNGNHKDTQGPYNENDCSREGRDPNGNPCDPRVISEAVQNFVDEKTPELATLVPPLLTDRSQELNAELSLQSAACNSIRDEMDVLLDASHLDYSAEDRAFLFGASEEYFLKGMHQNFAAPPKKLDSQVEREPDMIALEAKHIDLYGCDVVEIELENKISELQALQSGDLTDFNDWLVDRMKDLSDEEVATFADATAFNNWILEQIDEYLKQAIAPEDTGMIDPSVKEEHPFGYPQHTFDQYGSTASLENTVTLSEDREVAILEELNFQFQQGFEYINGVHRAFFLEELAKLQEETTDNGNLLPIQVSKHIGGYKYTIYLDGISFTPNAAVLDAYLILEDSENTGRRLVFQVLDAYFGPAGLINESRLQLVNDAELRLSNSAKLIFNGDGQNFVDWDCTGFAGMNIDVDVELCRNYIIPLDPLTLEELPDPARYRFNINTYIAEWLDVEFTLNAPPFAVAGAEDVKWQVENLTIDLSDKSTADFYPPEGYHSPFLMDNGKLSPMWKGFYLQNLTATLPNQFSTGTEPVTAGVNDVVIDGCGFSGEVFVENLLNIEQGSAGGWPFSVDKFGLKILHNNLAGADFAGEINVPIFEGNMDYEAVLYPGNIYRFSVSPNQNEQVNMFLAEATIDDNSTIDIVSDSEGFHAVAELNGQIEFTGTGGTDIPLNLPEARFSGFRVSNRAPYFDPGFWDISGGAGFEIGGFAMDIANLAPYKGSTETEAGLGFDVAVSLADEIGLSAAGRFGILGELQETNSRQKWVFKKVDVQSFYIDADIKDVVHVKGGIAFYEGNTTYGKGFQGILSADFKKLNFQVDVAGQFGKVNDYNYFFVDALADLGTGLGTGLLNITGFGGGVSYHMDNDFTEVKAISEATGIASLPGFGKSISGVTYTPDESIGLNLKATALIAAREERVFNGSVSLEFTFNSKESGGGLREISLKGDGHFLQALDKSKTPILAASATAPRPESALSAYIDLKYNFDNRVFDGHLDAFLKVGDRISGSGDNNALVRSAIYFSPEKWHINIGLPDRDKGVRAGIHFDLLLGGLDATAYFNAGTDIPDFPGLPANVGSLASHIRSNEGLRKSGGGFMFGADLNAEIELDWGPVYAYLYAGLGFDLMLRDYGDAVCSDGDPGTTDQPVGINGWYAAGQMWAYLEGGMELFGVSIFEAGLAAVMQARLPNPFWAQATVAAKVKLLFVPVRFNIPIEVGKRCDIGELEEGNPIGMHIISFTSPDDGSMHVTPDVRPEVYFNVPLGKNFQVTDDQDNTISYHARVKAISAYNETYAYPLPVKYTLFNDNLAARLTFDEFLPPGESIAVTVQVEVVAGSTVIAEEEKIFQFTTGEGFNYIPETNVEYSYPVNGMYEYFPQESTAEEGFIQLVSGQPDLFVEENLQVKLTGVDGSTTYQDLSYDAAKSLIKFPLPAAGLSPGGQYQISIVRAGESGEEAIFSDLYFRVSPYPTFKAKLAVISTANNVGAGKGVGLSIGGIPFTGKSLEGIDPFGIVSLEGTDRMDPLITFKADLSNDWYRNDLKPKLYDPMPIFSHANCEPLDPALAPNTVTDPADAAGIQGSVNEIKLNADGFKQGGVDFTGTPQNLMYAVPHNAYRQYNYLKQQAGACVKFLLSQDIDTQSFSPGTGGGSDWEAGSNFTNDFKTFYESEFPELKNGTYVIKAYYRLPNGHTTTPDGRVYITIVNGN